MVRETPSQVSERLAREAREAGVTGGSALERIERFGAVTIRDGRVVETTGTEGRGGKPFRGGGGVRPSVDITTPSSAIESNKARAEIDRLTNLAITNLNRTFRNLRFSDRNVKLQAEQKLSQDISNLKAQGNISKVEQGLLSAFTFTLTTGKERITSENVREFKQKLGFGNGKRPLQAPSTVISADIGETFRSIKLPLRNRIETFIKKNIPGGVTLVRTLKAGGTTLKEIEKDFPVVEDFLAKQDPRLLPGFVFRKEDIVTPETRATIQAPVGVREQTFEEKLGVEEDKDSRALEFAVNDIQLQLANDRITETEADLKFDDALEKFVNKKAIRNIPRNVALGLGLVALQAIPIVGQAVTGAFVGNAILRRRQLTGQIKKFPKATAISVASLLAGGLIGNVVKGGVASRLNNNIDPESLSSVSGILGKEKALAIKQATQVSPQLKILIKQQKITGFNVYDLVMKDGRSFRIVEFSKIKGGLEGALKGDKGLIGFQLNALRGEQLLGRGVSVIVDGKSQTFLRVLRFKPANSPIGRALQKIGFNKGKTIDVLQKSQIVAKKGQATRIFSQSKILSIKNTNRLLGKKISFIETKLAKGQKVSLPEIKNLINLERRSQGLSPFTEIEFRNAGFSTLTDTIIGKVLRKGKVTFTSNINTLRLVTEGRFGLFGISRTRPGIVPIGVKKAPITKTPLFKTFGKEPLNKVQFSQQVAKLWKQSRTASSQQLVKISKQIQNLKSRFTETPGALTLALANKLDTSITKVIPGAVPFVTAASAFGFQPGVLTKQQLITLETIPIGKPPSILQNSLINQFQGGSFQTRIKTIQNTILKLKQLVQQKRRLRFNSRSVQLTQTQVKTQQRSLQKLIQLQKLGQKLLQKRKQQLRQVQRGITTPRVPPTKITIPVPLIIGETPRAKKVPAKGSLKKGDFNVFVRKKGKDVFLRSFESKKQARKNLKRTLKITLRASGFIADKANKKLKPKISPGFRRSKIDPFRIVEIRSKRLSSSKERKDIQIAKRQKKPFKPIKNNFKRQRGKKK